MLPELSVPVPRVTGSADRPGVVMYCQWCVVLLRLVVLVLLVHHLRLSGELKPLLLENYSSIRTETHESKNTRCSTSSKRQHRQKTEIHESTLARIYSGASLEMSPLLVGLVLHG